MSNPLPQSAENPSLHCSFCGKSQHEVLNLIAGPTVFICNECIDLCNEIIIEEGGKLFGAAGYTIHVPGVPGAPLFPDVVEQIARQLGQLVSTTNRCSQGPYVSAEDLVRAFFQLLQKELLQAYRKKQAQTRGLLADQEMLATTLAVLPIQPEVCVPEETAPGDAG